MAKKQAVDQDISEIKKAIEKKNIIFGTEKTVKNIKLGKVSKVYLTSNCSDKVVKDIEYYAGLAKVKVVKLKYPNDELGLLCKRPYSISVASIKKGQ